MRDIDTLRETCQPLGKALTPDELRRARQLEQPRSDTEPAGEEYDEWDAWLIGALWDVWLIGTNG